MKMQCVYSHPNTRQFALSRGAPSREAQFLHAGRQSRRALAVSCRASGATNPHSPKVGAVALDVEFSMIKCTDGCIISPAAQVCLVDEAGVVLLKTYCRDEAAIDEAERSIGGVPLSFLHGAPNLKEVGDQILEICSGKLLVGHGLTKDLKTLKLIGHPTSLQYCTMTFPEFQGSGGNSRTLKLLAEKFLGISIQKKRELHDAEEDARAVMRLYLEHARPRMLDYDDLLLYYAQQLSLKRPRAVEEEEEEISA